MANFSKLIPGFTTDLNPKGVYLIGKAKYDFNSITEKQCLEIIASGSQHIKKQKPKAEKKEPV